MLSLRLGTVFKRPKRLANRLAAVSAVQLLLVTGGFSLLSYSLGRPIQSANGILGHSRSASGTR